MKHFTLFIIAVCSLFFVQSQPVVLLNFASGLSGVTDIKHAGDERIFVVEQPGRIKILDLNGNINPVNFLNITNKVSSGGERGLLGLAFSPDYKSDGYFYVNYTNTSGNTIIARYSVSAIDPDKADSLSEMILMTIIQPASNHNGGHMAFGPDGYLYIGMGDGGGANDPQNYGQNPLTKLGKMLRIDVSGSGTYVVPTSNPFVNNPAYEPEIWALGLRNPWRFSFDRWTGDLWIADVGQGQWEEINFQLASSEGGENWGWRCYEGNSAFNLTGCQPIINYDFPVHVYAHSGPNSGCSVTGGYVYRGAEYPNLFGRYFYADYCTGLLGSINIDNNCSGNFNNTYYGNIANFNPTTFGEDMYGNLYIGGGSGIIRKLADTSICQPVAFISCEDTLTICGSSVTLSTPFGQNFIYQWQLEGVPLPNSDTSDLLIIQPGNYSVMVVNSQFCTNQSSTVYIDFVTPPVVSFTGLGPQYCENDSVIILSGTPSGGTFTGNGINGNFFDPALAGAGTHTIDYTYTDINGCSGSSSMNVTVYSPTQPVISQSSDTLFVNVTANIQWLDSAQVAIPGETNTYLLPFYSGLYYVQYTDTNNCVAISDPFLFIDISVQELTSDFNFTIFPNPAKDYITITFNGKLSEKHFKIIDQKGRVIREENIGYSNEVSIKTKEWKSGIYYLLISNDQFTTGGKIILMND